MHQHPLDAYSPECWYVARRLDNTTVMKSAHLHPTAFHPMPSELKLNAPLRKQVFEKDGSGRSGASFIRVRAEAARLSLGPRWVS